MLKVIQKARFGVIGDVLQKTSNHSPYLYKSYSKDKKSPPSKTPLPNCPPSKCTTDQQNKNNKIAPAPCIQAEKTVANSRCEIKNLYGNPLSLSKVPVPPLRDTLTRLLRSAQPFVNDCDFYKTQKQCCEFEKQGGNKLQELLIKFAASKEGWLNHLWNKYAYLCVRDPIVINKNPTVNFHKMDVSNVCEQLELAAKFTVLCLSYKKLAFENKLPQEKSRCGQLEMESHKKIWGTARLPADKCDKLEYCPKSKHIVLVYKNNYFKVPAYGCDGPDAILSENDMIEQFNACIELTRESLPVGVLTADHRDTWLKNFQLLEKDRNSKNAMKEIREALFLICIDDKMPNQKSDYDMVTQSHQLLHGGGTCANTNNRWFDKTLQIIIGPTGMVGFNYEHTAVDGINYMSLADYLMTYSGKDCKLNIPDACTIPPPKRLEFCCSKEVLAAIEKSSKKVDGLINCYQQEVLQFKGYGKDAIKKANLSPDGLVQAAIQFAFFKIYNEPGAQYESGSTRIFIFGRTECIRSCSIEMLVFCKAMVCSDNVRLQATLLRKAIAVHRCLSDEASRGLGVDRHFMGLRAMSIENKLPLPNLYKDPGFVCSGNYRLSTSNISSKFAAVTAYGPAVQNGYAVSYNLRDNDIIFAISNWKGNPDVNSAKYMEVLCKCLMELKKVMECGIPLETKKKNC